jgi:phytoene desaturase
MSKSVVVIGGGMGGLAAAIRLAKAGVRVTLLEKNQRVGGKLNLWESDGFRFDTGPSLITMPFVFEQLFAAAGESLAGHVELVRLDPIARFVWPDGATFELRANFADTLEQVRAFSPRDVDGWRAMFERGREIWNLTADLFLYQCPEQAMHSGGRFDGLKMLTVPLRIGMLSRFSSLIHRHIKHPRLREVLYQYATYSGASPFRAPATLAVIPFVEQHFGGWYPRGGMYRLAEAVAALAGRCGVETRTSAEVRRVVTESGRAVGVEMTTGQTIRADAVIANSDVVSTYRDLIAPADRPKYTDKVLDKLEPGGSGLVLLLGVGKTFPNLAHHTKFMPADYRGDLAAMFETHTVPADPCIYVCATTRTDPTQAPPGCENLFVLCSAPAIDGTLDWSVEGPRYRDRIVRMLEERWGLTSLSSKIVAERIITPAGLAAMYRANAGSIYGIGSNSRRSAFLRPPNRDQKLAGMFFAGGATHPGGGLPLVALSGKIVSELVSRDFGIAAPSSDEKAPR